MGTYVGVLVKYALYYKQFTRIVLGTDIGGHCFSTSVNRLSTIGHTLENDDLETNHREKQFLLIIYYLICVRSWLCMRTYV
jgi:hypothetical protein